MTSLKNLYLKAPTPTLVSPYLNGIGRTQGDAPTLQYFIMSYKICG